MSESVPATPAKPACPDHPTAHVTDAKLFGGSRVWVCLICGNKLGPAPWREAQWESMTIEGPTRESR